MNRVLRKIRKENKEILSYEEVKKYCQELYFNHRTIGNYLISRGYLVKIFEDIYYVKSDDEIINKTLKYTILELLAEALKKKHIKNWYFGLYTALDLMDVKYEHDNTYYYLINDRISKNEPVDILGNKFRFLRFKLGFFDFGIKKRRVKHSDLEKTILDMLYLWDCNHVNENRILIELSHLMHGISKKKIYEYSKYYPKSMIHFLEKALIKV